MSRIAPETRHTAAQEAWIRGQRAAGAGDRAETLRWLDRARRAGRR